MTIHMARFLDVADGLRPGWTKCTGNAPPHGLRDPSLNEPKVLFELTVDRIATFGRP